MAWARGILRVLGTASLRRRSHRIASNLARYRVEIGSWAAVKDENVFLGSVARPSMFGEECARLF